MGRRGEGRSQEVCGINDGSDIQLQIRAAPLPRSWISGFLLARLRKGGRKKGKGVKFPPRPFPDLIISWKPEWLRGLIY